MDSIPNDRLKELLSECVDAEAFTFWAVIDNHAHIILDKNFTIVHDDNWKERLAHEERSHLLKQLESKTPVKIHESGGYTIASFCQEPPLYLITEKKKNNCYLKCLAELLYAKLSLEPRNNIKIEEYNNFVTNLFEISKLKKDSGVTSMGIAIEKLFNIIHEKYAIEHIAIYEKKKPANQENFIYDFLADHPKQGKRRIKKRLNLKNKRGEDGYLKQKNEKRMRIFFNNQSIVFFLSRKKKERLPTDQSALLEKYLQLFFLGILPFIKKITEWHIAQDLIGSLAMELYDSITSSQFLINKMQGINENSRQGSIQNCLKQLEEQIYNLEYLLSAYTKKNFNYNSEFTSINIKSLIRQALQQHPELEIKYTINTDLQEDLFISVQESPMLAVLNEIFKNILQHAFTELKGQEKDKQIVEISAGKKVENMQDYLNLTIRDHGKGLINASDINNVFEPGWKEEKLAPNAGMGLSFAYFVVTDVHCGTIKADSSGKGFSLIITLPVDEKKKTSEDAN